MLTSYTSTEENMPYLRKFAQNIRNNNESLKLSEDTNFIQLIFSNNCPGAAERSSAYWKEGA